MSKRHNVRSVTKSKSWKTFDRVWAEKGVIRVQSKNGRLDSMDVRTAVQRAIVINQSLGSESMPDWERRKALAFVDKLKEVIIEARAQLESPDRKTAALQNVLEGKTMEGKNLPPRNPEQQLMLLQFQYPKLSLHEIKLIASEKLPMQEKKAIMHTINTDRLMEDVRRAEEAARAKAREASSAVPSNA